jgi:ATP-dependent Clp protease ATP-binding subunit ClpB
LIIMTSNIGAKQLIEGIDKKGSITKSAEQSAMQDLRAHFRPEFLNRIDDIVLFKPLGTKEIAAIVDLQLGLVRERLAERRVTLELTEEAKALIAEEGYDPQYGARPLKRYISRAVETKIGKAIIAGQIQDDSVVRIGVVGGELSVESSNVQ